MYDSVVSDSSLKLFEAKISRVCCSKNDSSVLLKLSNPNVTAA